MLAKYLYPSQNMTHVIKMPILSKYTFLYLLYILQVLKNNNLLKSLHTNVQTRNVAYTTIHNVTVATRHFNQYSNFIQKRINNDLLKLIVLDEFGKKLIKPKHSKKLKISKIHWRIVKKYLYKNQNKKTNSNVLKKKIWKRYRSLSSRVRLTKYFKKHILNTYQTKKKLSLSLYKTRYKQWNKSVATKFKHTQIFKSTRTSLKTSAIHKLLINLFRFSSKRQNIAIFKKKIISRNIYKPKLNKTAVSVKKSNNYLQVQHNSTVYTKTAVFYPLSKNNIITTTRTINHNLKQITLLKRFNNYAHVNTIYMSTKKRIKDKSDTLINKNNTKQIYSTLFNQSNSFVYDINSTAINYVSNTPLLILKNFTNTKKNDYFHTEVNQFFNNLELNTALQQNTRLLNFKFQKNNHQNNLNNYFPLYFFNPNVKNKYNDQLLYAKTQSYYYNVNVLATTKYKTFFVFFLLNFLENFLKKRVWVRIDTKDPIDSFWKNYINFFLKKHMFLFKRFNKLIAVRELLEILWITFKNHDLLILLNFIKRKIEGAHFKKHKKILSIFFDVIRKNTQLLSLLNIKGFFFDIRGKVGVSGNAKKRHHSFSLGKITTTSQNLGSYFQQINVWTPTGQMGITCILQY